MSRHAFFKENDVVILKRDECYKVVRLDPLRQEEFEGHKFFMRNAVGAPYGTTFAVVGDDVKPLDTLCLPPINPDDEHASDNRNLIDSTDNQVLNFEDIENLRNSGIHGQEIVHRLVQGSVSFNQKTLFSKEKYLEKKKKRHLHLFSLERATTRLLCTLYARTKKARSLNLRFDTLAQMLMYANVHAGSTVLIAETTGGLLLSGILERIGPPSMKGAVIQFHHSSPPTRPLVQLPDPSAFDKQVFYIPFTEVTRLLRTKKPTKSAQSPNPVEEDGLSQAKIRKTECVAEEDTTTSETTALPADPPIGKSGFPLSSESIARRAERDRKRMEACSRLFGESDFASPDALLISTRFHPVELTLLLLQFLPLGKPFVVHTAILQPLVDLYNALKQRGGVANLRLTDTFFRQIQVLPERTHPDVTTLASGGYLLSGYLVAPQVDTEQLLHSGLLPSTHANCTNTE